MVSPPSPGSKGSAMQPPFPRAATLIARRSPTRRPLRQNQTHRCYICGRVFDCARGLGGHRKLHAAKWERIRREKLQQRATTEVIAPTNTATVPPIPNSDLKHPRLPPVLANNEVVEHGQIDLNKPAFNGDDNLGTDSSPMKNIVDSVIKDLGPNPKGKEVMLAPLATDIIGTGGANHLDVVVVRPDPANHPFCNEVVERGQIDLNELAFNGDDAEEVAGHGQLDLNLPL